MNTRIRISSVLTLAAIVALATSKADASSVVLLFEDWQDAGWSGTDINSATNAPLSDLVGYGVNTNNPNTTLGVPGTGGNVLRDQGGFGGTYGSGANAGNATRVRSTNGAMLNESPLQLATLGATSVTFSFDLKQNQANYVQVVEYSSDQVFSSPVLLDTIDGNSDFQVWIPKSYTVSTGLTDDAYFRIRKLRPSPAGTHGGANSTYHVYDNISITAEIPDASATAPEPSTLILAAFGLVGLVGTRRRRRR